MYRSASHRAEGEGPAAELVYDGVDRGGRRKPGLALVQLFALPVVVACICARMFGGIAGLVALGASTYLTWWLMRRRPKPVVVLRVENGELSVAPRGGGKPLTAPIRLVDLVDVGLETMTIQRVEDGSSAIAGLRFVDSKVGDETNVSRIVLVRASGKVPLSESPVVHMDATEDLGKIRVFLRKHGWVPADERESIADDDDESELESEPDSEPVSEGETRARKTS